ncbi:MAG: hypothetical protein ACPGED_04055, partial [Flavobacteriales bacterium]
AFLGWVGAVIINCYFPVSGVTYKDLYVYPTKGYISFLESASHYTRAKLGTKIKLFVVLVTDWVVGFG